MTGIRGSLDHVNQWVSEAHQVILEWDGVLDLVPDKFQTDRLGKTKAQTVRDYIRALQQGAE